MAAVEQSPYIEVPNKSDAVSSAPVPKSEKSSQQSTISSKYTMDWNRLIMYGIIAILVIFILWMLWSNANSTQGDGFVENPVRDDPSGDWNVQSEVAKLKATQEAILQKLTLSKADN